MSSIIITLYFCIFFFKTQIIDISTDISLLTLILADLTVIVSLISYIWTPKKRIFIVAFLVFLLLAVTSATLIISTNGLTSPFIALWMIMGVFASVFGLWGLLPILIASGVFVAIQYINGNLDGNSTVIATLSSILPLLAGVIIWRNKSGQDEINGDSRAYRSLASELSEVASKSEVVINAIGDGVIAIDNQGVIQLINPAAQRIIGWGKQDALALNYKSVLQLVNQKNEILDLANDPIRQALNINQQIRTNNLTLMTKSGKNLMISLVVSPVGEVGSGVIAVFHDVTNEKAEEREQAEFISTASHEMRTPVASIEGYLGLALNPNTSSIDNRARDFILKAHASAQHLGHLFQDLLDVSKADDGRMSNNPKVVDIVPFIHEIVQGLQQKASDKGLKLSFKPFPDDTRERQITPVYYVNLDNDHIREIMNNLIENAIKYTPTGQIIVDINGDDDHIVVSVKDSGIGIPVEDMSHLFQKFYRVDDKNTREIGGTGLGLYLCRRLTEIMGGRIWAESVYKSGSTFYIELPRINSQEANLLIEQEMFKAQQEANQIGVTETGQATTFMPNQPPAQPQPVARPIAQPTATTMQPVIRPQQTMQPVQPVQSVQPAQTMQSTVPPHTVPRSQSLTSEQIAAYVARQRALALQQAKPQLTTRPPQPVSIPTRNINQ